jgi:DNA-binding transcriptional MerR regulator
MTYSFSRQEAATLSGLKPTQLDYLAKQGIIEPQKIGHSKHPVVLYDWNQLLELKIVAKFKQRNVPSKYIYCVLEMIRQIKHHTFLVDKYTFYVPITEFNKNPEKYTKFASVIDFDNIQLTGDSSEVTNDNHVKLVVVDRKQLDIWHQELFDDINHNYLEWTPPLGDIEEEVREAVKKYVPDWKQRTPQVA